MSKEIPQKKSFGSVTIDSFSPAITNDGPDSININISFEEALKLHLGLGQALAQLNKYNRATKAGRQSGVNLCVFTRKLRATINESRAIGKAAGRADCET